MNVGHKKEALHLFASTPDRFGFGRVSEVI